MKISLKPALILNPCENAYTTAYFLKTRSKETLSETYQNLGCDPRISKVFFLSGNYDFLVTTLESSLSFREYKVSVLKKSLLYAPLFTHPQGWRKDMKDALNAFACSAMERGVLERELGDFLPWENIHWNIFYEMKDDARRPFRDVGRAIGVTFDTVKKHFYGSVLPYCGVAHYFFPKGYDSYHQSLIMVKSDYERDLITSLNVLPCTSYIYPLEGELMLCIFNEGVIDLMRAFKKLEEAGIVDEYLLLVPLSYTD